MKIIGYLRMQEIEKILISGTNKAVSFEFKVKLEYFLKTSNNFYSLLLIFYFVNIKTENVFLLGSPLAVFLTLRGKHI